MKEALEKLNDLVDTGTPENIDLVFIICESQGAIFEELESVQKYVPIIKWLSNYLDGYDELKEGLVKVINLEGLDLRNKNIKSLPDSIGNLVKINGNPLEQ